MGFTVDIKGNASHLDKTIKNVKTSLSAIGSVATTAATSLAGIGVAGGAAMAAFIITSSKAAADVEDLGIQFEVLTGSAKTAAELMKTFREEEEKSALNLSDYATAAKTMLAFGASVEGIMPALRMIGDVSMGNSERFGSLALAFAQTTSAGRLMGQEVLQFVNAGFNPLEQISRDTGRSMQDLKKDMEDGAITVDMVKQAFINATSEGGRFYKAIEKGSNTTSAKLNQFNAAVTQLKVGFGTGFNDGLKVALDATNNFLPQLEGKFKDYGFYIGEAIKDGVNGNMEKLEAVGEVLGTAIGTGFKIAFKKIVMGTIEGIFVDYMDLEESAAYNKRMKRKNDIMDAAVNESDPTRKQFLIDEANKINTAQPSRRDRYDYETAKGSASKEFSDAMKSPMNKLESMNTAEAIENALKSGQYNENMTKAVREGVLEAWAKQPTQNTGAKFSN